MKEGNISQREMNAKLEMFMHHLTIYEDTGENSRAQNPEPES